MSHVNDIMESEIIVVRHMREKEGEDVVEENECVYKEYT